MPHAPVLEPGRARWSVAYGANACPDRLVDKGLDARGALLLPAVLEGWEPVFEGRRTAYGAVPLTLVPAPGRRLSTWVLGVHEDDTDRLDRSEGRRALEVQAPGYRLGHVGDVAVADRFVVPDALAYVPGPATRVQRLGDAWRRWPDHDQPAAVRHLDDGGELVTPPRPAPEVVGDWPATPLRPLALFVYGTLCPGAPAWELVAGLVEVLGPATTRGCVHDTGNGWPAAHADGHGTVHGVLLRPVDARAGAELLRRTDDYEGAPRLFVRTAVRVDGPTERTWAAAYLWASGEPPGRPLPSGRWHRLQSAAPRSSS